MPTELWSIGYPHVMVQSQIYALPSRRVLLFSQSAASFEISNEVAFTTARVVTLGTNQNAELGGGFIRCTASAPVVVMVAQ